MFPILGRNSKFRTNKHVLNLAKDKYIFYPRQNKSLVQPSFSAKNIFNLYPKENTFYIKKKCSPLYYYRKIELPYKYNITSIPEYLIKANEEKIFINKLKLNEKGKKKLNEMDNNIKIKDIYKPEALNALTMLKYYPDIFLNSMKLDTKNTDSFDNNLKNETITDNNNSNINITDNNNNEIINNIDKKYYINTERKKKLSPISKEDQIKYKYKLSDIYNLRNDTVITNKSAEKYLFKKNNINNLKLNNNNFNITSMSGSDWIPNKNSYSKMNFFSSVNYNILSPKYKGFNKFVSPSELNKNNLYNENPSFHRVKSISEFIDISHISSRNNLSIYKKDKIPNFKFKGNVATDHLNAYHINRDLIPSPT